MTNDESLVQYLNHNETVGASVAWKMTKDYFANESLAKSANEFTGTHPVTGVEWKTIVINTKARKASDATGFQITQKQVSLDWYRNMQKPMWAVVLIISFWTIICCGGGIALLKRSLSKDSGDGGHGHAHEGGKVEDNYYRVI